MIADHARGARVTLPLWAMCLDATKGDPLEAQQISAAIAPYPDDVQRALIVASHGNAERARQIIAELSGRWWYRWLAWMEQRHTNHNGDE